MSPAVAERMVDPPGFESGTEGIVSPLSASRRATTSVDSDEVVHVRGGSRRAGSRSVSLKANTRPFAGTETPGPENLGFWKAEILTACAASGAAVVSMSTTKGFQSLGLSPCLP
jgi:hypothetical protein